MLACITACGILAFGKFDCSELKALETRTLAALQRHAKLPSARACASLRGWVVTTHPHSLDEKPQQCENIEPVSRTCWATCPAGGWWLQFEGEWHCVSGYTWSTQGIIEIGDEPLQTGAFSHELVHALDHMAKRPVGHCKWTERGVKRAIWEATCLYDSTVEACASR